MSNVSSCPDDVGRELFNMGIEIASLDDKLKALAVYPLFFGLPVLAFAALKAQSYNIRFDCAVACVGFVFLGKRLTDTGFDAVISSACSVLQDVGQSLAQTAPDLTSFKAIAIDCCKQICKGG